MDINCALPLTSCPQIKHSFSRLICPRKGHNLICTFVFDVCVPLLIDSRTLRYEETVIITLATVSVLAVLAVAAFFGYRMMHGELPWRQEEQRTFIIQGRKNVFSRISIHLINGIRAVLLC